MFLLHEGFQQSRGHAHKHTLVMELQCFVFVLYFLMCVLSFHGFLLPQHGGFFWFVDGGVGLQI